MKYREEEIRQKFSRTSLPFQAVAWLFADLSYDLHITPILYALNDAVFYGRAKAHPHLVFMDSFGSFERYKPQHLEIIRYKLDYELGKNQDLTLKYLRRTREQPSRIWLGIPRELVMAKTITIGGGKDG